MWLKQVTYLTKAVPQISLPLNGLFESEQVPGIWYPCNDVQPPLLSTLKIFHPSKEIP